MIGHPKIDIRLALGYTGINTGSAPRAPESLPRLAATGRGIFYPNLPEMQGWFDSFFLWFL